MLLPRTPTSVIARAAAVVKSAPILAIAMGAGTPSPRTLGRAATKQWICGSAPRWIARSPM